MHMGWRSLQLRSYASTITRILELSAVLGGSITSMALLELGKACFFSEFKAFIVFVSTEWVIW